MWSASASNAFWVDSQFLIPFNTWAGRKFYQHACSPLSLAAIQFESCRGGPFHRQSLQTPDRPGGHGIFGTRLNKCTLMINYTSLWDDVCCLKAVAITYISHGIWRAGQLRARVGRNRTRSMTPADDSVAGLVIQELKQVREGLGVGYSVRSRWCCCFHTRGNAGAVMSLIVWDDHPDCRMT